MTDSIAFHLPIRPYSPIDALNRRAAALGSPRYAAAASHADYNGHHVTVQFNDYRQYYTCEYWYAGRNVLRRGTAIQCVEAAVNYYERGALGASVTVFVKAEHAPYVQAAFPGLQAGKEPQQTWYTWQHQAAAESARDAANPRMLVMFFDWPLMQAAPDREAYEAALKIKYGRVYC